MFASAMSTFASSLRPTATSRPTSRRAGSAASCSFGSRPPRRERPRELTLLATSFLDDACRHAGRTTMRISDEAMAVLLAHSWPGNVRELKNLMQYVAAALAVDVLRADHLSERLGRLRPAPTPSTTL